MHHIDQMRSEFHGVPAVRQNCRASEKRSPRETSFRQFPSEKGTKKERKRIKNACDPAQAAPVLFTT